MGMSLHAGEQLRQDALDEFTRKTGIGVDLIPTLGTSAEQIQVILQTLKRQSRTPDIFLIDIIWPGTLHDHLIDLKPYFDKDARGHIPELVRAGTVNDRVVSLPLYVNVGMLHYRADLLKRYGYARPPDTWKELEEMASRIQAGERARGNPAFWGYVWQGEAYEGLTCNALEWQASFGGGRIIEQDGSITVNNDRTLQALLKAAGWVGSISPPSVLSYRESDAQNLFRSGKAAFMRLWGTGFRPSSDREAAQNRRFDLARLPGGPEGHAQAVGGFYLGVSRYSAHLREAVQLVLYLTGSEVQYRRALHRGYLPTLKHLYTNSDLARSLPQVRVLKNTGFETWVARPSAVTAEKYAEVQSLLPDRPWNSEPAVAAGGRAAGPGAAAR
jgi:trehalose/maltose transport system substrate-binding protein